jgi:selenocysteine-specific elongation factor
MPVVGTAGHVDHGKSTLILALTGRDPDRWEEEKRRGLTIDLGFAWTTLPGGTEVSFVDVPGHERFIKNMLAGVEAIDVALLVVAADEGWAAQSEEHLAVLELLGVTRGVVALTKVDRVDEVSVGLAREEIAERIAGTGLETAPVVAVAAPSGIGLDLLQSQLEETIRETTFPSSHRPRMWIDRSFSVPGAGTVVTGTLQGGGLEVGMTVQVWPFGGGSPESFRIRGLESHEVRSPRVEPHRRVAVNLAGAESRSIGRGSMLGLPGQWEGTRRFLVEVRPARYFSRLPARGAYQIHIGSGAFPLRLRLLQEELAVCELEAELCLQVGDRFILRDTGRRAVVGGGRVLDPAPPRKGSMIRRQAASLRRELESSPDQIAQALLAVRGTARRDTLAAHSGGGHPDEAVEAGELLLDPEESARLQQALLAEVDEFHRLSPLRPGIGSARLAAALATTSAVVEKLAGLHPELTIDKGLVARSQHRPERDHLSDPAWLAAKAQLEEAGLSVPRIAELGLPLDLVHALVRAGELVKIGDEFVYLPAQVEQLRQVLATMPPEFTVSDFRARAGISRKYAVPFLEWADGNEITLRRGDRRTVRA